MNSPVSDLLRRFSRPRGEPPANAADVLRRHAEPLPALDSPEFGKLFDRFGDASVVLIGEASHGTQDFYQIRCAGRRAVLPRHVPWLDRLVEPA